MARLVLKFDSQVLREIPIGAHPLTIGRAPDNDVHIDNLAVSDHHARLYAEGGKMVIEDLGSLNGTYVNEIRVDRAALRDGDNIQIGKHQLQLDTVHETSTTIADSVSAARKMPNAKIADATEEPHGLLRHNAVASPGAEALSMPSADLLHAPTAARAERTHRSERIHPRRQIDRDWQFTDRCCAAAGLVRSPVGAQINHHPDGYYLGLGDRVPKLNGQPIHGPTRLRDGDIIQVGRVRLQFSSPD